MSAIGPIADLQFGVANTGITGESSKSRRVGKGALAPCPPNPRPDRLSICLGGHASLCPPYEFCETSPPESCFTAPAVSPRDVLPQREYRQQQQRRGAGLSTSAI